MSGLGERTRVYFPLGVLFAGGLAWMIYMQLMLFQVKEDVAVIRATIVPPNVGVATK